MDETCDEARFGLDLGLGLNNCKPKRRESALENNKRSFLDLSIPLDPNDESNSRLKIMGKDVIRQGLRENSNNNYNSDGFFGKEDDESKISMDFSCKKKLRLTRDQTTLLEDSFKQQTTLNTAQKQALAEKLNLKPRQVEVWFQNRRARTKLKQTEVDCEFWKRTCERLSEENWRLKKEVFELRSLLKIEKQPPPPPQSPTQVFHHNPKAAREKNGKNRGGGEKKEGATEVVHSNPKT